MMRTPFGANGVVLVFDRRGVGPGGHTGGDTHQVNHPDLPVAKVAPLVEKTPRQVGYFPGSQCPHRIAKPSSFAPISVPPPTIFSPRPPVRWTFGVGPASWFPILARVPLGGGIGIRSCDRWPDDQSWRQSYLPDVLPYREPLFLPLARFTDLTSI